MDKRNDADFKRTISSLLFFSFRFDLDDLKSDDFDLLRFLANKAYVDATNQGAFNTVVKGKEEPRKRAKSNASDILVGLISGSPDGDLSSCDEFDSWHNKACSSLVEAYKNEGFEDQFTYGNAQKWINMTLKYADMLIPIYNHFDVKMPSWLEVVKEHHSDLHAPVDSYIIEAVWNEEIESLDNSPLPLLEEKKLKKGMQKGKWGKYSPDKVKGWSVWEYEDYERFHSRLGQDVPIEWEAPEWIRIAKERRKSEEKRRAKCEDKQKKQE